MTDTPNRYTLHRAALPQRTKGQFSEGDLSGDLIEPCVQVTRIRTAQAKVLSARANLTIAIGELEAALHATAPSLAAGKRSSIEQPK